jgi:hypothetical protein
LHHLSPNLSHRSEPPPKTNQPGGEKKTKEKKMFSLNRLPNSTETEIDLCRSLPSPNFQFANQQQQNSSSPSPISSSSASKNLHLFICFKNLQSLSFKTDFFHEDSQCEAPHRYMQKITPKEKKGKTKREREKKKRKNQGLVIGSSVAFVPLKDLKFGNMTLQKMLAACCQQFGEAANEYAAAGTTKGVSNF